MSEHERHRAELDAARDAERWSARITDPSGAILLDAQNATRGTLRDLLGRILFDYAGAPSGGMDYLRVNVWRAR